MFSSPGWGFCHSEGRGIWKNWYSILANMERVDGDVRETESLLRRLLLSTTSMRWGRTCYIQSEGNSKLLEPSWWYLERSLWSLGLNRNWWKRAEQLHNLNFSQHSCVSQWEKTKKAGPEYYTDSYYQYAELYYRAEIHLIMSRNFIWLYLTEVVLGRPTIN